MKLFIQNVQRQFSKMQKINTLEQSTFNGSTEKEEPMKSAGKEMPKSQEETETKNEGNTITNHKRDQGSWGKNLVDCAVKETRVSVARILSKAQKR